MAGLYEDETLRPLVETYGALMGSTTYLAFEVTLPEDAPSLRLTVASGRADAGDLIIEGVVVKRGSITEVLGFAGPGAGGERE